YGVGTLNGSGGIGFNGVWAFDRNGGNAGYFEVNGAGLSYSDGSANDLPVSGGSVHRTDGDGRAEANREFSEDAKSALFADGTTMWFSALYRKTDSSGNAALVIGSNTFTPLNGSGGGALTAYASGAEGFGFGSSGDQWVTALAYDNGEPTGLAEVDSAISASGTRLIVGKIEWSPNGINDTLTLYNVDDLTSEPTTAIATISADLNQATFNRVAIFSNNAGSDFDEIRLGTSFASVVGNVGGGGSSDDTITMTATTATDVSGVEYYFAETSGNPGGDDSGWQDSPIYTDTGLQSGTEYTYTVKARDKSAAQNETAPSTAASATTTGTPPGADTDPPTPNPASFASAPAAISDSAISMTATTGSDDSGPVEYFFTETSGNPGGDDSGWQISPTYADSGLNPDTEYTYTVTMRDTLGNTGTASAAASATTQSALPLDVISVNFYAYGGLDASDHDKVTLESGETAGVGSFNVGDWENFQVPFGLTSPMSPVSITGNQGATATLTLNDVRNGWVYAGSTPHSNFPGDGNGDLMDGHCNGTEDPYDGSAFFDMEVSSIPYDVYDLIVYMGSNAAQFGDGTGNIVLNGGAEQGFTLPSGEFAGFAEITDPTTPGNYIIFTGLRDPSLTLRVWGNGFNHIGPSGFQIVKDNSGLIPPGPASNPAPVDGSVGHSANVDLSWTAGVDAVSRNVYLGTDPTPDAGDFQGNQSGTTFDPGTLAQGTYYWRIDEVNDDGTTPGPVWSFEVGPPAKAFRPMPWDGMSAVSTSVDLLRWVAGESATTVTHDVYFGTDSTPDGGEFQGNQTGTTFAPGTLSAGTTYYWRVDQVNSQGTTTGDVWSFTTPINGSNKVKVFILAGQSNMEGHGEINPNGTPGTLESLYNSDTTAYAHLKDGGSWAARSDAWISYKRGGTSSLNGDLGVGYGASSSTIGPELQFGHAMGDYFGQKVLLIKTAWGGKSLRTDFRPPTVGWGKDVPITNGDEGYYFKEMLDAVVDAMANIGTNFPAHNPSDGFEIVGFGWHQGWNDRVSPTFAAEYETNMVNFIHDVRASLGVPNLPFVIATTGMDGNPDYSQVELAQLQMENFTAYPQFDGNVSVIDTQAFWFDVASSPADQGYHWNRNAESYYKIGDAMAAEMQTLVSGGGGGGDTTPPSPNPASFNSAPSADGDTSISMTATTGSDPSGVEYLFTETSGNPGGLSSSWQSSPSYTNSGLTADTQYSYTVTMRDGAGNVGSASSVASATTTGGGGGGPTGTIAIAEVFGHHEENNYDGVIGDMINGSGMNGNGQAGVPGWPAGEDAPDTWTTTDSGYVSEWQSLRLLDPSTDGKVGWAIFDLGSEVAALEELYLWHVRENDGRYAKTFNVYVATTPSVPVSHGPTSGSAVDYDFASGGWTLVNTGGALDGSYRGNQVVALGGATARYIGIEILTNNGDSNRVGFAEVAVTAANSGGGNDFSDWITGYPGVGGETGIDDDPDGDGVDSGVENFFGTDPSVFSGGLTAGGVNGTDFTFTHPQSSPLADDLTAAYRWSTNLQAFHADGALVDGTRVDFTVELDQPSVGTTTVTATVSGTPVGQLFIDVQVTETP
ncbi:MAG: sialate O-acetylesterase, partial [Haloferula sp.]